MKIFYPNSSQVYTEAEYQQLQDRLRPWLAEGIVFFPYAYSDRWVSVKVCGYGSLRDDRAAKDAKSFLCHMRSSRS